MVAGQIRAGGVGKGGKWRNSNRERGTFPPGVRPRWRERRAVIGGAARGQWQPLVPITYLWSVSPCRHYLVEGDGGGEVQGLLRAAARVK